MKVLPVSFSFNSRYVANNYNELFLYTKEENKKKNYLPQYAVTTATLALSAVLITLFNLGKKRKLPESIVEISDLNKGLNKIKNHERTVEEVKSKFIYPIKAALTGDTQIRTSKKFKTGLVITDSYDKETLEKLTSALTEHFSELKIDTVTIQKNSTRVKGGKKHSHPFKKNELIKQAFNEIEKAAEKFHNEGKYTVINLGNVNDLTDLQVIKNSKSKFDKLLEKLGDNKYQGIIWVGWTTKYKSLPLYFNDLPVLVTKLAE